MWITVSNDEGDELERFEVPMQRVRHEDGSVWRMIDTTALYLSLTRIANLGFESAHPES